MIFMITILMLWFSGIIYKGVSISNFNFIMLVVLPFLFVLYIWIDIDKRVKTGLLLESVMTNKEVKMFKSSEV